MGAENRGDKDANLCVYKIVPKIELFRSKIEHLVPNFPNSKRIPNFWPTKTTSKIDVTNRYFRQLDFL
jgi:hypothetical protein